MSSAFPHRPPVEYAPREQRSVVISDGEPNETLRALSSETAREILGTLREDPATASEIASAVDRSLQNVSYHLDHLCEAGLVTPAGTWYSTKGREMTVYALVCERLVVEFGGADPATN